MSPVWYVGKIAMNPVCDPLYKAWKQQPAFTLLAVAGLVCFVISATGLCCEPRGALNDSLWIKPCKFGLSMCAYAVAFVWLSQYITAQRKLFQTMSVAALIGGVLELGGILLQTIRGISVHFDTATMESLCISLVVRFAILPVAIAALIVYCMLAKERNLPPVVGLSMKWGVFLTIIGFIPGIMMMVPGLVPGHHPGLPFLGWSVVSGDLRAAHFVGIHALQVLPIIGCAIRQYCDRFTLTQQEALVSTTATAYFWLIVLMTWQALRAESLIAPSVLTVSCLVAIIMASAASFVLICTRMPAAESVSSN